MTVVMYVGYRLLYIFFLNKNGIFIKYIDRSQTLPIGTLRSSNPISHFTDEETICECFNKAYLKICIETK